jgi:hypothetical protein
MNINVYKLQSDKDINEITMAWWEDVIVFRMFSFV